MHLATRPAPSLYLWPTAGDLYQAAPVLACPAAFAALTNCTRCAPCAHDAGRIAARRPPGRSIPPAPAPRSAPARALALPRLTARHAACKWRGAIVATASRLPGYAVPSGTTPAACAPGFLSPATACPPVPAIASPLRPSWQAIRGLRLAAGCRVSAWAARAPASARPRPPWLSGCAGSHCVARFRLARLPPVRPRRWLPKSRRWRDGELWISRLFSPSLHHECRSAGVRCHKTTKNQGMALAHCRICYLLLTLFVPFFRLLPSSERGR